MSTFGFYQGKYTADVNAKLYEQMQVLYCKMGQVGHMEEAQEFALDLDRTSQPSQVVLACVEPKGSLAATWDDLKTNLSQPSDHAEIGDLVVPNLNFKVDHRFKELETHPDVIQTHQSIEFLLDKSGVAVGSQAYGAVDAGIAVSLEFTRPFLIVMRKRGATEPYFVMWVDNAELLCKQAQLTRGFLTRDSHEWSAVNVVPFRRRSDQGARKIRLSGGYWRLAGYPPLTRTGRLRWATDLPPPSGAKTGNAAMLRPSFGNSVIGFCLLSVIWCL